MAKYEVTLYYHTSATVTVSAKNEEEAIEKAYNEVSDEELLDNMQEDDSPDAEKIS